MKSLRIVILGFENALPSGISGYVDLFVLAGMAFRRSPMSASLPSFEIIVATPDGQPFSDGHGRKVKPDRACEDIDHADAVLIAGFFPNERGMPPDDEAFAGVAGWLRDRHVGGAMICGSCCGPFVIGVAGLLDGRRCTTTWWLHDEMRRRFPRADAAWGASMIEDGRIVTAGGPLSWADLSLHVIRTLVGPDAARLAADFAVIDTTPMSQSVYVPPAHLAASDPFLVTAEQAVRSARGASLSAAQLAKKLSTSERTLHRRLTRATGEAPRAFIERIRFETARTLLDTAPNAIKQIALESGYRDEGSFRRAFRRHAGMTPSAYREWSSQRRGTAKA